MRLLFDHNVPAPLRRLLISQEITLAAELGWHEVVNGELLAAAERAGFDVLLTSDQNIRFSVFDRQDPKRPPTSDSDDRKSGRPQALRCGARHPNQESTSNGWWLKLIQADRSHLLTMQL